MNIKKSIVFIILLPIVIYSCNNCNNLECASGYYGGRYTIIDSKTKKDLLFGNDRIYNTENLRFFSLKGKDTINMEHRIIFYPTTKADSLVELFLYNTDTVLVKLNRNKVDTIFNSYRVVKSKCCGNLDYITGARLNNGKFSNIKNGEIILEKGSF